jgi:hypothetical protein
MSAERERKSPHFFNIIFKKNVRGLYEGVMLCVVVLGGLACRQGVSAYIDPESCQVRHGNWLGLCEKP